MSRTLVIGDIHGSYKAVLQIIERAKVTVNDTLIFLGDYVDGWGQSPEVIELLIALKKTHKCIFIRGNHDDLLLDWLKTGEYTEEWFIHGGRITADTYNALTAEKKQEHIDFFDSLREYYLDDKNRLFVHAGFSSLNGVKHEYFTRMFFWDRTLWETAMAMDKTLKETDKYFPKRLTLYKEIFIGHTPVTRIGHTTPVNMANVWNVDTGAAFKGPLTIMDIISKEYWQSDPVYTLYPEENGRN
ncbi:metallophosphoesterase family protein [Flavobacterium sp. DG1-102-2]|uniref:metallophosphoesterase family protein n=1 Tax=Flavobacterium sp. DG1-102-2 TaxID=3081663 RepID=UPI002949A605|nr:metallophosphoesterase family protein [Flavobacterium sp. DG1-102-2]MDV6169524.1 metallophosphoesterase family protein [Flavobacterium sp. DG1-102-2]